MRSNGGWPLLRGGQGGGGAAAFELLMPKPTGGDDGAAWNAAMLTAPPGVPLRVIIQDNFGPYSFQTSWIPDRSHLTIEAADAVILNAGAPWAWDFVARVGAATYTLSSDIAQDDDAIALTSVAGLGVGDEIQVSWPDSNMGCLRTIVKILGTTVYLNKPIYWPMPAAFCTVFPVAWRARGVHIFGGTFKFVSGSGTNQRITEMGGAIDCSYNGCRYYADSGTLAAVLALDVGNDNIELNDVEVTVTGTATALSLFSIEPGSSHITLNRCIGRGANPTPLGINATFAVTYDSCSFHGGSEIQQSGGVREGKALRIRKTRVLGGIAGAVILNDYVDDFECTADLRPLNAFAVKVGDTTSPFDDAARPTNIRFLGGNWRAGTSGIFRLPRVNGLEMSGIRFDSQGLGNNSVGVADVTSTVASAVGVVIRNNTIDASGLVLTNWLTVGKPCVITENTAIGAHCYVDVQASGRTVIDRNSFSQPASAAGVPYLPILKSSGGASCVMRVTDNAFKTNTSGNAYCMWAGLGVIEEGSNTCDASLGAAVGVVATATSGNCRILGGDNWGTATPYVTTLGPNTMTLSRGSVALNGATPVLFSYPAIRANDVVRVSPISDGRVPQAAIVVGVGVTVTGYLGNSDTVKVEIE